MSSPSQFILLGSDSLVVLSVAAVLALVALLFFAVRPRLLERRRARDVQYDAFISYSHAADGLLGPGLQSLMERIAKPWFTLRAMRIFLDQTDLSVSPGTWSTIEDALRKSRYLVFLASPEATRSKWVSREVGLWLNERGPSTLLIVLTDGNLAWLPTSPGQPAQVDWSSTTALPRLFENVFVDEPLWVDLRQARRSEDFTRSNPDFFAAAARLTSKIRGIDLRALISRDHREHRRTIRTAVAISVVLVSLLIASIWLGFQTSRARDQALLRGDQLQASNLELSSREPDHELDVLVAGVDFLTTLLHQGRNPPDQAVLVTARLLGANRASFRVGSDLDGSPIAAISPDGRLLFVGGAGGKGQLWDPVDRRLVRNLEGMGEIASVRWTPDSRWLVIGRGDGIIQLWQPQAGKLVRTWRAHRGPVTALATYGSDILATLSKHVIYDSGFSPENNGDGGVALWRLPSGGALRAESFPESALSMDFSPDGRLLAVGTDSGEIFLLPVDRDAPAEILGSHPRGLRFRRLAVYDVSFFSQGKKLVSGGKDSVARVWDLSSRRQVSELRHNLSSGVYDVEVSSDGRWIGTASSDGTARLWNAGTGEPESTIRIREQVLGLRFNAKSTELVTWSGRAVQLWSVPEGEPHEAFPPAGYGVRSAEFSPDGSLIVRVTPEEARLLRLAGHRSDRRANPDSLSHGIVEVRARAGDQDPTWLLPLTAENPDAFISPTAERAILRDGSTWRLVDLETGVPVAEIPGNPIRLVFSDDGRRLFSLGVDGVVHVFETATGAELDRGPKAASQSARLASAGFIDQQGTENLLLFSEEGPAVLWDYAKNQVQACYDGPTYLNRHYITTRASDLISLDREGVARLWWGVGGPYSATLLSVDATAIASYSENGGPVVGTESGDLIVGLNRMKGAHRGRVVKLAAARGRIISLGSEGECHAWLVKDDKLRPVVSAFVGKRCSDVAISPDGAHIAVVEQGASSGSLRGLSEDGVPGREVARVGASLLGFADSGETLVTANGSSLLVTAVRSGATIARFELKGASRITAGDVSEDGKMAVAGDDHGRVWLARSSPSPTLTARALSRKAISSVQLASDGQWFLALDQDAVLGMFSTKHLNAPSRPLPDPSAYARPIGLLPSRSGKLVVVHQANAPAKVWKVGEGRWRAVLGSVSDGLRSPRFSPDEARLAAICSDGAVRIWDLETGTEELEILGIPDELRSVEWSSRGDRLVTTSLGFKERDNTVRVWDSGSGKLLHVLQWDVEEDPNVAVVDRGSPNVAVFAQGDQMVVAGGHSAAGDSPMRAWELPSERPRSMGPQHAETVNALALAPDGQRLASASDDGTVKIWNLETLELTMTLAGDGGLIDDVRFSTDGSLALAVASDGRALVLPGDTHHLIAVAAQEIQRQSSRAFERIRSLVDEVSDASRHIQRFQRILIEPPRR